MSRTRRILLTFLCLLTLFTVPVFLSWREVRQERLNQALITAIDRNDTAAVRSLLHQGADPNAPILPEDKRSFWQRLLDLLRRRSSPPPLGPDFALFEAIRWRVEPQAEAQIVDNPEVVKALVETGANVNCRNFQRSTPLMLAAWFGKAETVKVLLAHHAQINATNEEGDTALILTAAADVNVQAAQSLLDGGADINAKNQLGLTALSAAIDPDFAFFHYRASANMQRLKAMVGCLLRHGASVQARGIDGVSLLSLARTYHDKQLIQMLKQAGAR